MFNLCLCVVASILLIWLYKYLAVTLYSTLQCTVQSVQLQYVDNQTDFLLGSLSPKRFYVPYQDF